MISSNGGTWSTTQANFNNVVKAFKFAKGDTVTCEYDPVNSQLVFGKEKTVEQFKLELKYVDGDPFHPCVLFYYLNDEVEFINNFKEQ
jgi:hypothetical protein